MKRHSENHRVFLDTSVLVGKILNISREAEKVFNDPLLELYTNEYTLKELYHVLKKKFSFSELEISYAVDYIRETCEILPMPRKNELRSIQLTDKADRPIVHSARKFGLILYIDDERTYREASKYVEVKRICRDR